MNLEPCSNSQNACALNEDYLVLKHAYPYLLKSSTFIYTQNTYGLGLYLELNYYFIDCCLHGNSIARLGGALIIVQLTQLYSHWPFFAAVDK